MSEVSRRESKNFARPDRNFKWKSRVDSREAERYQEALQRCSCAGRESGFGYHPSFPAGEALYQFLATSKSRRTRRGATRVGYRLRPRLKILIPDTLVFNVEDDPQWFCTDKDGFVACTSLREPGQAIEVFGDVRFEEDLVAVRKQSCLLPFGGFDRGHDPAALYSNGNSLSLVNTRDLRMITGATGRDVGGGGRPATATTDGGETFLIQKFIKSKGPHAFIIRQTVETGMPPTAWIISNRKPYGEEINAPDSLLMAESALIGRFATTPAKDRACGIARLGPGACVESAEAARKVLHHLESVMRQRLEVLVVDFTKDDRGRLWLLQVKAFRFLGCTPQKPFRLPAQARRDAYCRLRGEKPPSVETPSMELEGGELRDTTSTMFYCRKNSCGMCGAMLYPEDVAFRMTTRMIKEALFHIWSRLSPDQVPPQLRPNAAAIAAVVSGSQATVGGRSAAPAGDSKIAINTPAAPSASDAYRNVFVCRACFTLHQTENLLSKAEHRLGAAIRAPPARRTAGVRRPAAGAEDYLTELWRSRARRRDIQSAGGMGEGENRDTAAIAVDPLEAPKDLTLCRFLVVITDILDVPQAFLDDAASRARSLELRYEFLGAREAVQLEIPVRKKESTAVSVGGDKGDDCSTSSCLPSSGRRAVRIPVHSFRLFSFLAEATPLEGELPSGSGLDTFLSCQREIVLGIISLAATKKKTRMKRPPGVQNEAGEEAKSAGKHLSAVQSKASGSCEARLGLEQLKNGHIRKIELQAPLLLSGALDMDSSNLIIVRAYLGLERVRSNVNIAMLPRPLWYHRGIYIIGTGDSAHANGFHTCDPLPQDWVDIGRRFIGSSATAAAAKPATAAIASNKESRKTLLLRRKQRRAEAMPTRARKPDEGPSLPKETMEEYSGSVWGMCICMTGVRRPEGLAQEALAMEPNEELDATRAKECVVGGTAAENLKKAAPYPTPTEMNEWQARCLIFGHAFSAETSVGSPPRRANGAKTDSGGGAGISLPLGGLEVHAYIQCGVARLRRLFSGETGGRGLAAALQVELLQNGSDGLEGERVRGRCEVPLETLVDTKYVEGTYPLFEDCAKHAEGEAGTPSNAHHNIKQRYPSSGTSYASLELAVHLYRMGPMNSHRESGVFGAGIGADIVDIEGKGSVCWKPPSLVEVGQIVGLDRVDGSSSTIHLFGRPPFERKS